MFPVFSIKLHGVVSLEFLYDQPKKINSKLVLGVSEIFRV